VKSWVTGKEAKPCRLSLREALRDDVMKLRMAHWAFKDDHVIVHATKTFMTSYYPTSGPAIGVGVVGQSITFCLLAPEQMDAKDWEEYFG
jgi:hypothetical protein